MLAYTKHQVNGGEGVSKGIVLNKNRVLAFIEYAVKNNYCPTEQHHWIANGGLCRSELKKCVKCWLQVMKSDYKNN